MKTQRPSHHEPRPIAAALKYGETGPTWGNLRAAAGEIALDDRFVFEGDEARRVFQVTRDLPDPLDQSKRLFFYEAVERDPWPDGRE